MSTNNGDGTDGPPPPESMGTEGAYGLIEESSEVDFGREEAMRFFEVSLDLFCIASPDGHFLHVNPEFERVLGYDAAELTSRTFLEFVHPDDREATRDKLAQLGENRDVTGFRNRYICKDGSVVWLEWQSRSYEDQERIYASARDITDLKRAELERERLELQFQEAQKMESVAVLAGGIAHDFNNLLTTILGNAGLISMQLGEEHPAHARAEAIKNAAKTAADLCEQLLAYAGEGQFEVEPADLSAVVEETDHLLEAAVANPAELTFDLDHELPAAELDSTQVQQILMNVVTNASEALDGEPGEIRVTTGMRQCDRNELRETYLEDKLEPGRYVYLEVTDDGCGMEPDELERIFAPFYSTKFEGRGLGLAATLGIVRAHDGTVDVESKPGEGTRFRFYFPAFETATPFTPEPNLVETGGLEGVSVLLVDDQGSIREFAESTLQERGIELVQADNGVAAVETVREQGDELSAVLLDLTMPQMDGERALGQIRQIAPDLPVILSSGYSRTRSTDGLPDDAIAAYLQKPYGPHELVDVLSDVV